MQQHIKKDQTPWPSVLYASDARIIQYMQINECDALY